MQRFNACIKHLEVKSVGKRAHANTILFLNTPILEISTSTMSPLLRNVLGFMKAPTPAQVPVMTAVPAGMVVPARC